MAVIASTMKTFVDITDTKSLGSTLGSNLGTIQLKDVNVLPNTFSPNWATTPLKLTPALYLDADVLALTASGVTLTWKRKVGGATETALVSGETVAAGILTVNKNVLNDVSSPITYICYISYYDAETKTTTNKVEQMTFTLLKEAENAKLCAVTGEQTFKYDKNSALVGAAQIALSALVQNVNINTWQYKNASGAWVTYPTTNDNANVTGATLIVKPAHAVFFNNVATIKLATDDANVYDVISITKIYDGPTGATGAAGKSISNVVNHYLASTAASGVTTETAGWTTTPQSTTTSKKYLWWYQTINYSSGNPTDTTPGIIGTHGATGNTGATGATGVSITGVIPHYLASTASAGVTTETAGWTEAMQATTTSKKYLWFYQTVNYSSGSPTNNAPVIIGTHGATGATGAGGLSVVVGNEAQTISCTNGGLVQSAVDVTIPFYGYKGTAMIATTVAVGTLPSGVTVKSNAASTTSAAGTLVLTFAANAHLGAAATLNGTIDLTFTLDGKTVVKKFSWSKSNKGNTGATGAAGADAVILTVLTPKGNIIANGTGSLTLEATGYKGATAITSGATYQWAKLISGTWTNVSGATAKTLNVNADDVTNVESYRCTMTYASKTYTGYASVYDKTDPFVCEMLSTDGFEFMNGNVATAAYIILRRGTEEVDSLLGPISTTAPSSPKNGDYYYKLDKSAKSITLMKYNGSAWAASSDKQEYIYNWYLANGSSNNGTVKKTGKVVFMGKDDVNKLASYKVEVDDGL